MASSQQPNTMIPWFSQLIDEDILVLGEDCWPYGIAANREVRDGSAFSIEDIFVPEFLAS